MDRSSESRRPSLLERLGLKRQKAPTNSRANERVHIVNPYHAVSIAPCLMACENVRRYAGKRFLSSDAPILPVPGCGSAQCRCRYLHHDDRRQDLRRTRDPQAAGLVSYSGPERRGGRGRRAND